MVLDNVHIHMEACQILKKVTLQNTILVHQNHEENFANHKKERRYLHIECDIKLLNLQNITVSSATVTQCDQLS